MLAGQPPFAGGSIHALMAQHLTGEAPSLRARRADVSPALDAVVRTALAKLPDERHSNAHSFAAALEAAAGLRPPDRQLVPRWLRPGPVRWSVAAAGILIAAVAVRWGLAALAAPALDPMRIATLPFLTDPGADVSSLRESARLRAALARWTEIDPLDQFAFDDGLRDRTPSASTALETARRVRAGHYLHGSVTAAAGFITLNAGLYSAENSGALIRRASMRFPVGTDPPDSLFALLADSLLFGRVTWDDGPRVHIGTRSYYARRDYGAAHEALQLWDLPRAESLLVSATIHDPAFARGQLWLAQVRNWAGEEPDGWQTPAERALAGADALGPREQQLARGLVLLARAEYADACRIYDELRTLDARDFAAWYGRGECHARDRVVVRDSASPSGWSFRSSYHQAVEAYRRAFQIMPQSFRGFSAGGYERIRRIFFTRPNRIHWGTSSAGFAGSFPARPQWQGDTLALLPLPWAGGPVVSAPALKEEPAVEMHRRAFHEIAATWVRSFPADPEAVYALAASLEMRDDPAALDTLERARSLVSDPRLRLRLAASEVWLRVKFGFPDEREQLARASALADSLVRSTHPRDADEALILGELAVLIGRPVAAAELVRRAARTESEGALIPAHVVATHNALLAFAAVGGPLDSIATLEQQAEILIRRTLSEQDRAAVRRLHLERPAFLAFPEFQFEFLKTGSAFESPVAAAQANLARGDTARARTMLASMLANMSPVATTVDILYPIATLQLAVGDTSGAVGWLAEGLESVRWTDPGVLDEIGKAGVLPRTAALLSVLYATQGDAENASRWAAPATTLWANGDRSVQPLLAELRSALASINPPVSTPRAGNRLLPRRR